MYNSAQNQNKNAHFCLARVGAVAPHVKTYGVVNLSTLGAESVG